ncbi:MAG: hypothetical protein A3F18_03440 [Legionellales bacterium RIFCSPHIGHO2_12_FULL_37_14]|nr:MAG: hypothetical protein A3F18_03440 [Legionellales bacterium RIFCSPHIGHO2_12_FULL_37_14]
MPQLVHSMNFTEFWQSLWHTPNQQADLYMQQKDYKKASQTFTDPSWKGAALYRAQDYQKAAEVFKNLKTLEDRYNLGNSLAHLNEYQQAIDIFDAILKQNPQHKDAKFNRDILQKLLEQQKQQPQNNNQQPKDQENKKNEDQQQNQQQNQQEKNPQNSNQQEDKNNTQQDPQQNKDKDTEKQDQQEPNAEDKPQDNPENKQQENPQATAAKPQNLKQEQQKKANDQWLKLIKDDPGGLLKQQFLRDHLRRMAK